MRHFLVCIHDATPAYAGETQVMIRELAPFIGRRLSFGVVPNWNGVWPLAAHAEYCQMVQESSEELLLHGYFHQRHRGWGPITLLTGGCDEMNGLGPEETRRTVERGQHVFSEVFGKQARGFLAPAWQRRHVRLGNNVGLEHILGFFSLQGTAGREVPLATWAWDCGRWSWLGGVGHGIGSLLQSSDRGVGRVEPASPKLGIAIKRAKAGRVPTLAIHPGDLARGFWPKILRLTEELLKKGYEPTTPARLLEASDAERNP